MGEDKKVTELNRETLLVGSLDQTLMDINEKDKEKEGDERDCTQET